MSVFSRRLMAAAAAAVIAASFAGCGSADTSSGNPNHIGFTRADGSDSASESAAAPVTSVPETVTETQTTPQETVTSPTETTSAPAETTTTTTTTVTTTTTSQTTTTTPEQEEEQNEDPSENYEIDAYGQKLYKFSDSDESFLSNVTFVGDSICYGLEVYDYMPPDNVLAVGSVAARNIFDFTFDVDGVEYGIIDAIKKVQPKIIVFSMGMNDINLTTPEQYCSNYMNLLDQAHAAVPSAKLYVASITPISNGIDFNNNTNIDNYNAAIKQFLADSGKGYGYVDIAAYLKDQWNGLSYMYSGGDGIHLKGHAYSAILYQVCRQLN